MESKVINLKKMSIKGNLILVCLLSFGTPIIFTNLVHMDELYNLPKTIFANLILIFLITLAIFIGSKEKGFTINPTPLIYPFAAFLISQVISCIDALNIHAAIKEINIYIFLFLITLFTANIIREKKDVAKILNCIIFASSLTSIVGIFQYLRLFGFKPLKDTYDADTFGSFMGHANFAAAFIITVIPLILVMTFYNLKIKRKAYSLFLMINLILNLCFLYITFTRSSWVGIAFALLFFIFVPQFRKKAIILFCILLIFTSIFGSFIKDHEGKTLIQKAFSSLDLQDDPIEFRILAWTSTLRIIKDHFINGTGGNNFNLIYPKYRMEAETINTGLNKQVTHTHNDYLEFATDYGIIGFFSFIWIIALSIFIFIRIMRRSDDEFIVYTSVGIGCGIIALLVDMFFNFSLHLPASSTSFFILLGLLSSLLFISNRQIVSFKHQNMDKKISSGMINGSIKKLPAYVILIILILGIFLIIKPLLSSFYTMEAMQYENAAYDAEDSKELFENLSTASKKLEKALFFSSRDVDLRYLSAVYYNFLGLYQKSLFEIDICLQLAPYTPVYHCLKGIDYYNLGNLDKAEIAIKKSIEYDNLYFVSHAVMGNIYRLNNEFDKAVEHYNHAQDLKPKSLFPQVGIATVSFEIGDDFMKKKNFEEARKWFLDSKERYTKVLKAEEDNIKVLNNLGVLEFRLGNSQKGMEYFLKAEEIAPNHPSTNTNLGMIYDLTKNQEKAIYHFKKVLKYIPNSPLRFRLAQLMQVPVTALSIETERVFSGDLDKMELNQLWMNDNLKLRKNKIERKNLRSK